MYTSKQNGHFCCWVKSSSFQSTLTQNAQPSQPLPQISIYLDTKLLSHLGRSQGRCKYKRGRSNFPLGKHQVWERTWKTGQGKEGMKDITDQEVRCRMLRLYTHAHILLLPASISWHCCPKTCEKVTGPAAELEVTGEESIALFGSFVLVMGQSPAAVRSLLSPHRSSAGRRRPPEPSPEPRRCKFLSFQGRVAAQMFSLECHQYIH